MAYGLLAFEKHAQLNRRAIDIAGDQKTMPETAQILSDAKHKPVIFERVPIEALQKYIELKPDGPNAPSAKEMIAQLGGSVSTTFENPNAPKGKKKGK